MPSPKTIAVLNAGEVARLRAPPDYARKRGQKNFERLPPSLGSPKDFHNSIASISYEAMVAINQPREARADRARPALQEI
jgi:hypothetical protein